MTQFGERDGFLTKLFGIENGRCGNVNYKRMCFTEKIICIGSEIWGILKY